MARSVTLKNDMAQSYADDVAKVSVHTGDPGTTGANDSGVTHQDVVWSTGPTAGVITSDELAVPIPADTHMTHVGLWDSTGNFLEGMPNDFNFAAATTY